MTIVVTMIDRDYLSTIHIKHADKTSLSVRGEKEEKKSCDSPEGLECA